MVAYEWWLQPEVRLYLLKDFANIFARILQDLQGFDQDLAKILGKIPTGSYQRFLEDLDQILEDLEGF